MTVQHVEADATRPAAPLPYPGGVLPLQIEWTYAIPVIFYHLIALLALLPWFFSWTGVFLAVAGLYVFGTLGINLCYHRLLAHRGLVVPTWLEHSFAILAVCSFQDTPARWVAVHRRHHQHADDREDPHSPLVNLFWSHMGWLLVENRDLTRLKIFDRYARDVLQDRFYKRLERNNWLLVVFASWIVFFAAGFGASLVLGATVAAAAQFGLSLLIWGVFVRTVAVWHITWSVNSLAHRFGYRNYETDEDSRNNLVVGLISNGEGWHNNHHADPRSARHGHRWWEIDNTWLTIRFLERIGLATDVVAPNAPLTGRPAHTRVITRGSNGVPVD
jgi:fatty-acid desaturase